MAAEFSIDRHTGTIRIGEVTSVAAHQPKVDVLLRVSELITGFRDLGNGYDWLDLRKLTFGGQPAALSLCFHHGLLSQAGWSVQLPDAPAEDGWPTREAIDAELAFVRRALDEMGVGTGHLSWGEVWSGFDEKGFLASSGLRYLPA